MREGLMDPGSASVLAALIGLVGVIITARTMISVAKINRQTPHDIVRPGEPYEKEDHKVQDRVAERGNKLSKLTLLLRVSPGIVSLVIFGFAMVAVFVYVPFVSDYALWFLVVAYMILAIYQRSE
jgi:hypothetical protein